MKRITAVILTVLLLVPCLAGCMREDINIRMNEDGTGSLSITIAVKNAYYEEIKELGGNPFEGKTTFETEYDGEKYIAVRETIEYASYEEMQSGLAEMTYDTDFFENSYNADTPEETETEGDVFVDLEDNESKGMHIFKDVNVVKNGSKYVFSAILNRINEEVHGQKLSDVIRVSVTIEMPAKISEYKSGKIEGNKIVYDISDMGEDVELYAACVKVSKIPAYIGIGIAVVAGIACIILKKRK